MAFLEVYRQLTAMGFMPKDAENLVLFERAEILDILDQRFVSVKRHD